jgi:hypothetical protein
VSTYYHVRMFSSWYAGLIILQLRVNAILEIEAMLTRLLLLM